jgi:hypothetical protein
LALAELGDAELTGPGQLAWLDRLETDHDNLLAAMSWRVGHGPLERAVHLFLMTWRFWWLLGHAAELVGLEDQMVADSVDLPPFEHARALTGVGFVLLANEDEARVRQVFEQSLPLFRQVSEKLGVVQRAGVLAVLGRWVPKTLSPYATWAYSRTSPPSRSRRRTRPFALGAVGRGRPAGGFCCSARCGRWML